LTIAKGCVLAGRYSITRAARSVLGATSTASVFRLFFSESSENTAASTFWLPSWPKPANLSGERPRGNQPDCWIFSLNFSAAGCRLSGCS